MNTIRKHFTRWQIVSALFVMIVVAQAVVPMFVATVSAAALQKTEVRFDRMNASQATSGMVCAQPATTSSDVKTWEVAFPTGYTVSSTASNWQTTNISTSNIPSGASAWPNATSATASIASQTVTWTNSSAQTMNAGTLYCYRWTAPAALSIKSSATTDNVGSVTTKNSSSATIDTGNYATSSLGNNCGSGSQACDQIYVSATVNSTFSFSLTSNTAALGTLSSSSPSSATAVNARVSTNAQAGWQIWAADLAGTPGLTSSSASKTIAYSPTAGSAASALSAGAEGFNIGAGTVSGTCNGSETYDAAFDNTAGTSYKGGGLDNTYRTVVSGASTAANCDTPLTVSASIAATTPAATDYAATITVVGAGIF